MSDEWIEFSRATAYGGSFVADHERAWEGQRRTWRSGGVAASSVEGPSSGDGRGRERRPLSGLVKYLAETWPKQDEDYPSPEKIETFEMDLLFQGDSWKWEDVGL